MIMTALHVQSCPCDLCQKREPINVSLSLLKLSGSLESRGCVLLVCRVFRVEIMVRESEEGRCLFSLIEELSMTSPINTEVTHLNVLYRRFSSGLAAARKFGHPAPVSSYYNRKDSNQRCQSFLVGRLFIERSFSTSRQRQFTRNFEGRRRNGRDEE